MTILQVKASSTPELMALPGVVGVGIQKGKIVVYTKKTTKTILSAIPLTIRGYDVGVIEIGEIFSFAYVFIGNIQTGVWQIPLLVNYGVNVLPLLYFIYAKRKYE